MTFFGVGFFGDEFFGVELSGGELFGGEMYRIPVDAAASSLAVRSCQLILKLYVGKFEFFSKR